MAFSSTVTQWLSRYNGFVNNANMQEDTRSMRSLGPGSGTLWDLYPFTAPSAYHGIFAGISVAGVPEGETDIRLHLFKHRYGFRPAITGPFSGNGWQTMMGKDWAVLDPTTYTSAPSTVNPVHTADITFSVGSSTYDTSLWQYTSRDVLPHYRYHFWWKQSDGVNLAVMAVTFLSRSETIAPFLLPRHVESVSPPLDLSCILSARDAVRFFGGLTILSEGDLVHLNVTEGDTLSKDDASQQLISAGLADGVDVTSIRISRDPFVTTGEISNLAGATANSSGGVSISSTGTHRIMVPYDEVSYQDQSVRLQAGKIGILSRDEPCCTCEQYVEAYEEMRSLFVLQAKLIEDYNELFVELKGIRDELESRFRDARQPVHIRRNSFVFRGSGSNTYIDIGYTLIYSSFRENEQTLEPMTFEFTYNKSQGTVTAVAVKSAPADFGFRITAFRGDQFDVPTLILQPFTNRQVHLSATVRLTANDVDREEFMRGFELDVLPLPDNTEEGDP